MKKLILGGLAVVAIAVMAFWFFQSTGFATPDAGVGYSHNNYIGAPHEGVPDGSPERTGYDRPSDRTPDAPASDLAASGDGSGTGTGDPDCKNGPGDGTGIFTPCGHPIFAGDGNAGGGGHSGLRDHPINLPGDGLSDNTPDLFPAAGFDRMGESLGDAKPERTNSDKFLEQNGLPSTVGDRVGVRDCAPADVAVGECDRAVNTVNDGRRDRTVGRGRTSSVDGRRDSTNDRVAADIIAEADDPERPNRDGDSNGSAADFTPDRADSDATPDRVNDFTPDRTPEGLRDGRAHGATRPGHDLTPDGVQDRDGTSTLRDKGIWNHSQPARDAYSTGPGDRSKDFSAGSVSASGGRDAGGFGFGGAPGAGGGGGGCSYSTTATADGGLMLAIFLPLMIAFGFKLARKAGK